MTISTEPQEHTCGAPGIHPGLLNGLADRNAPQHTGITQCSPNSTRRAIREFGEIDSFGKFGIPTLTVAPISRRSHEKTRAKPLRRRLIHAPESHRS
ncbi:MAG: hypothetical protein JNK76_05745 [Planctomycetales bacterium]|nr:hypothetical protein [Planctomycetales bacterium]